MSRKYLQITLVLVAMMTGDSIIAGTTHYRWIDDRGEPIFSDRPPPQGVDYEVISTGTSFKREVKAEEGAVPREIEPRVGNQFEKTDTDENNRLKKNPELCARAKTNLEALNSAPQVKIRNSQGEIRLLSPEEMEIEKQTAEAQVGVYCD